MRYVEVTRVDEGLWRWTADHPEWTPDEGGEGGWEREVGCVFVEAGTEIALIDPLVPSEPSQRDRFWRALDRDLERAGAPPTVLISTHYHARSARDIAERYRGTRVLAPDAKRAEAESRAPVTGWFSPGEPLTAGVEARPTALSEEVVFWIPARRTLVTGDVVLGATGGGLRLCSAGWLGEDVSVADLAASLRPLLELPIERVLPAHGVPILSSGREALAAALG